MRESQTKLMEIRKQSSMQFYGSSWLLNYESMELIMSMYIQFQLKLETKDPCILQTKPTSN